VASALLCAGASMASYQLFMNPPTAQAADKDKEEKERHPRMRAALHELREARKELKEADHDFGGHREEAVKATDHAIEQIEKALKWAHEHDK
jgi:hypothetical protein